MQLDLTNNIRQLRRRHQKTQESLAAALGVTSQAVSRWEAGGSYPDITLIPSIANYFGVTIDELFGYQNERENRINALAAQIRDMKWQNNGADVNLNEAISTARNALVEFPGNEQLMVCLASVLFTAGYSRHGEHHLTDAEGYDVFDTERHKQYAEWTEAIQLYEKAIPALEDGDFRRESEGELVQLYVNTGMYEKARALAEKAPGIHSTKEYMRISACDGKERVQAYGQTILELVHTSAVLMVYGVLAAKQNMTVAEKISSIQGAIHLFETVCPDGNCGEHHRLIARIQTFLSVYLWLDGRHDEAFEALDHSLEHFRKYEALCAQHTPTYTAPLLQQVAVDLSRSPAPDPMNPSTTASSLSADWPWWRTSESKIVKAEMQADPRWDAWVAKTRQ